MENIEKVSTISERLREAMRISGKKQVDLVKETGINRSAISRYLSGEYEPKTKPIYALAKALNVSEQWLMGYDCQMERPLEQKNSDAIVDITDRLFKDNEFRYLVEQLYKLDDLQIERAKSMLALLFQETFDEI